MQYYGIQGNRYDWTPSPVLKKNIGKYITTTDDLQRILDGYYTKYMDNKLKLYTTAINRKSSICLTNNRELLNLVNIVITKRLFNSFRKNNTLTNLINLYKIIYEMLINYDITNSKNNILYNYSCFYMLFNLFKNIKKHQLLQKYFYNDGILINLITKIRQHILMLAHSFLKKIYSSYEANYSSVMLRKLTNISSLQNLTKTTSSLSTNPISSPISPRNNEQKYDAVINLYIQFLSMYNEIIILIDTFKQYTTSTGNLTTEFIKEIKIMFDDISKKNKLLFEEYIKYLGRVEIGNSVGTRFLYPNANALVKGLFHKREVLY